MWVCRYSDSSTKMVIHWPKVPINRIWLWTFKKPFLVHRYFCSVRRPATTICGGGVSIRYSSFSVKCQKMLEHRQSEFLDSNSTQISTWFVFFDPMQLKKGGPMCCRKYVNVFNVSIFLTDKLVTESCVCVCVDEESGSPPVPVSAQKTQLPPSVKF